VEACQSRCIEQALEAQSGNWAQAARQLGMDASNLHKLARRLGVKRDEPGGSKSAARTR
jgi:anaerobic nitric oxide reductase transcription regulator